MARLIPENQKRRQGTPRLTSPPSPPVRAPLLFKEGNTLILASQHRMLGQKMEPGNRDPINGCLCSSQNLIAGFGNLSVAFCLIGHTLRKASRTNELKRLR